MKRSLNYLKIFAFYCIFAPALSANQIRELCWDTDHLEPIGKQLCSCERKYTDGLPGKECMTDVINKNKSILAPSGLSEELAAINMMCALSYHYIMQRQMRGKCEPSPAVRKRIAKEIARKQEILKRKKANFKSKYRKVLLKKKKERLVKAKIELRNEKIIGVKSNFGRDSVQIRKRMRFRAEALKEVSTVLVFDNVIDRLVPLYQYYNSKLNGYALAASQEEIDILRKYGYKKLRIEGCVFLSKYEDIDDFTYDIIQNMQINSPSIKLFRDKETGKFASYLDSFYPQGIEYKKNFLLTSRIKAGDYEIWRHTSKSQKHIKEVQISWPMAYTTENTYDGGLDMSLEPAKFYLKELNLNYAMAYTYMRTYFNSEENAFITTSREFEEDLIEKGFSRKGWIRTGSRQTNKLEFMIIDKGYCSAQ